MKIDKNTTIEKILEIEGAEDILKKYNLPCLSCPMASLEIGSLKIGEVSEMYGLDIDSIIKELEGLSS